MGAFVWTTVAILVLCAIVGVVAAFLDRRRGRQIEHDLGEFRPPGPE